MRHWVHTDADLDVGGLAVPKGDYTLFVNLANPASWELIVNKQTGRTNRLRRSGGAAGNRREPFAGEPGLRKAAQSWLWAVGRRWEAHAQSAESISVAA